MIKSSAFVKKSLRYLVVFWAFTVLWIYVGNIINFHQHRIWGKQLLPVASYSTRSKENNLEIILKTEVSSFQAGILGKGLCSSGATGIQPPPAFFSIISAPVELSLPVSCTQLAHSLRGPPIC